MRASLQTYQPVPPASNRAAGGNFIIIAALPQRRPLAARSGSSPASGARPLPVARPAALGEQATTRRASLHSSCLSLRPAAGGRVSVLCSPRTCALSRAGGLRANVVKWLLTGGLPAKHRHVTGNARARCVRKAGQRFLLDSSKESACLFAGVFTLACQKPTTRAGTRPGACPYARVCQAPRRWPNRLLFLPGRSGSTAGP